MHSHADESGRPKAIATTDATGCTEVDIGGIAGGALCVRTDRHYPCVVAHPKAGDCSVVLRERSRLEYVVTRSSGEPLAGLRADVCQGSISESDLGSAANRGVRIGPTGQVISTGWSDANGLLRLECPRGRVHVLFNMDNKPLIISNLDSAAVVDAPFAGRLTVAMPLAAVVSLQGDEVVVVQAFGREGVTAGGNHIAAGARATAHRLLDARFPGSVVICEAPFQGSLAGTAFVRAYGRTSGWHEFTTPMVEFDKLASSRILNLQGTETVKTARVRFIVSDGNGGSYRLRKGDIVMATRDVGDGASFDVDPEAEAEVPCGTFTIRPSGSGLPLAFDEISDVRLSPGQSDAVAIRLHGPMRHCAIRVRWNDGSAVSRGSISYWDRRNAKKTRLIGGDSVIRGWVAGNEVTYSVTAGGRGKVDGVLSLDEGGDRSDTQELLIVLAKQ